MAIYLCFSLTWRFSQFTITGLDSSYVQNWLENKLASWFAFILPQRFPCQICSVWKIWPRAGFVHYLLLQAKAPSVCWPKPLTCTGDDILFPGKRKAGIAMHLVLSAGRAGERFVLRQEPSLMGVKRATVPGDHSQWLPGSFLLPFLPPGQKGRVWGCGTRQEKGSC